ncbi:MAG: FMN-binding glutamate synthase family protein [Micrococcales bacterium]|nr:FMN-binding glutamate synthase family protein [Micrococcales bacterium]
MKPLRALATAGTLATAGLTAYDLTQKKHAILRNFPVIGHARYLLEAVGPELRQYIVTSSDEERPWVYASSKKANNYFGFGTDNDVERTAGYPIVKHRTFSTVAPPTGAHSGEAHVPAAKVIGAARGRRDAFRPGSVVNVSAMSFGSLSTAAITALNQGAAIAGCMHNTGEGGLSPYHRQGGELVLQIGTAYFGCRDEEGRFDIDRLVAVVESAPVRMIEIKLSQGAKPGLGGLLPAAKITEEIAEIRGIPLGKDCASPSRHAEFDSVDGLLDFVELIAERTGKPVGIKSAVGDLTFWEELVREMSGGERGVDFITIDGGEGGTGAAPLVFTDSVSLPWRVGFSRVYRMFAEAGLTDDITFIGSGKLGLPENAIVAFALGADMVNVAREAMLAIGCIQSQKCHTDKCPTGVATQEPWLVRGLDPASKAVRLANYVETLRRDLLKVSEAVGVLHPSMITCADVDILDGDQTATPLAEVYHYKPEWGLPSAADQEEISRLMSETAVVGGSAPESETAQD